MNAATQQVARKTDSLEIETEKIDIEQLRKQWVLKHL